MQALLQQLVGIPSVTGTEQALALWCEQFLQAAGFVTQRQAVSEGRFNLLAQKGSGDHALLLYAHLDTVAPVSAWQQNPFELQRLGDRLLGLGCSDMKGGLAVILQAAAQAQPTDSVLKLALTVDEEAWSLGAWELVGSSWCQDIAAALVPEIAIDSPELMLGLGRRGYLGFELHVQAGGQHAAVPQTQPQALEMAAQLILKLPHYPLLRQAPDGSQESLVVRGIQASSESLSVPDACQLQLAYFSLPGHSQADIQAELSQYLAANFPQAVLQASPRPTPAAAAYAVSPDAPFVQAVQASARAITGAALATSLGWSGADENILATALGIPVLSLAPVGGKSHQAQEWVSLSSLETLRQIYTHFLEQPQDFFPFKSGPTRLTIAPQVD